VSFAIKNEGVEMPEPYTIQTWPGNNAGTNDKVHNILVALALQRSSRTNRFPHPFAMLLMGELHGASRHNRKMIYMPRYMTGSRSSLTLWNMIKQKPKTRKLFPPHTPTSSDIIKISSASSIPISSEL
jgi:hypothetical protein